MSAYYQRAEIIESRKIMTELAAGLTIEEFNPDKMR
jgi:hypothetical protein